MDVPSLAYALSQVGHVRYEGPNQLFPTHETIVVINNKERPIFLEFNKKTPDGFYEITSDYTGEEIFSALTMINDTPDNLIAALIGTPLTPPDLKFTPFVIWTHTKRLLGNLIPSSPLNIHRTWSNQLEHVLSDCTPRSSDSASQLSAT